MKDGKPRWIAPAHVCHIGASSEGDGLSSIFFASGATITVREHPEDLVRRIARG